jgi:hypothetical protein
MCPICIAAAAWFAAGATSAGGLTALAVGKLRARSGAQQTPPQHESKEDRS